MKYDICKKWVELYSIMLSKASHSKRQISRILSYMQNLGLKIKFKICQIRKIILEEEGDQGEESRGQEK